MQDNRPFPSSKKSHFQSEAKCEAIDMKMVFYCDANKTHFHNKGFALSLVLKVRFFGTRKWPMATNFTNKCAARAMLQSLDLFTFGGDVTTTRFRYRRRLALHDFIFCLGKQ